MVIVTVEAAGDAGVSRNGVAELTGTFHDGVRGRCRLFAACSRFSGFARFFLCLADGFEHIVELFLIFRKFRVVILLLRFDFLKHRQAFFISFFGFFLGNDKCLSVFLKVFFLLLEFLLVLVELLLGFLHFLGELLHFFNRGVVTARYLPHKL